MADVTGNAKARQVANEARRDYAKVSNSHVLGDTVQKFEDWVDYKQEDIVNDNPTGNASKVSQFASELLESAGRMVPGIAVGAATGGVATALAGGSTALSAAAATAEGAKAVADTVKTINRARELAGFTTMFTQVYDQSFDESVAKGYDYGDSGVKAFADATLEVLTEKMFAGITDVTVKGNGWFKKVAEKANSVATSTASQELVKKVGVAKAGEAVTNTILGWIEAAEAPGLKGIIVSGVGEAIEEMTSEVVSPFIERLTVDPDAQGATIGDIAKAGIGGFVLSAFMSPVGIIAQRRQDAKIEKNMTVARDNYYSNPDNLINTMLAVSKNGVQSDIYSIVAEKVGAEHTDVQDNRYVKEDTTHTIVQPYTNKHQAQVELATENYYNSSRTEEDFNTLRSEYARISDEEYQLSMDAAKTEVYKKETVKQVIEKDQAYITANDEVSKQEANYKRMADRYNELQEQGADVKTLSLALKDFKASEISYKKAVAAREQIRKEAESRVDTALRDTNAREKYGDEAVDNFEAAQRFKDLKNEDFVIEFGRTMNIDEWKQRNPYADADARLKRFNEQRQEMLKAEETRINKALSSMNKTGQDFKVKVTNTGESGGYENNVISINAKDVYTKTGMNYVLGHELFHAITLDAATLEDRAKIYKHLDKAADVLGYDKLAWATALENVYGKRYENAAVKEANQKKLKDKKERSKYIEERKAEMLANEYYAWFFSTMFGSQSAMQAMATYDRGLLEKALTDLKSMKSEDTINTLWDYNRLLLIDDITKALASPKAPENVKDEVQKTANMAFQSLQKEPQGEYTLSEYDGLFSKVERALNAMDDKTFLRFWKIGDDKIISELKKAGVSNDEITWGGIKDALETIRGETPPDDAREIKDDIIDYLGRSYGLKYKIRAGGNTIWDKFTLPGEITIRR